MATYLLQKTSTMKQALKYIIILFGFTIPSKAFAIFWLIFLMYIRQDIYKPEVMSSWKGFFLPQIKVEGEYLTYNECEYIFPSQVKAFRSCCDSSNNLKSEYAKYDSNNQVVGCVDSKGDDVPGVGTCICAQRVLADCRTPMRGFGEPLLGCFKLPLGPPPPPFCDTFEPLPQIKIVPLANNNRFDPKIKVMVGLGDNKKCDNNIIVNLNTSCADGSIGEIHGYKSMTLGIRPDGTSHGLQSLSYNGVNYFFEAKKDGERICGLYYGNNSNSKNIITSVCYDLPNTPKPIILNQRQDIEKLLSLNNNIFIDVITEGYNNNKPFKLQYSITNGGVLHQDTKLKLIRPQLDENHLFKYSALCYDENGNSTSGTVDAEGIKCPEKYKTNVKLKYSENKNGTVLCISEEEAGLKEYMVSRNGNKVFKIKELGKAFIPHSYDISSGTWLKDYRKNNSNVSIENSNQVFLDKIKIAAANIFTLYPHKNVNYNAKYKNIEIISSAYNIPIELRNQLNTFTITANEAMRYGIGNSTTQVVKTNFVNSIDNTAFFLTKDEEDKGQYMPLDPYMRNLCISNFSYVDYTNTRQEEFFTPASSLHNCDFISIEAWGGGAASHIFSDPNDPLTSQHGKSFSGASGGYTKGIISVDQNNNTLKMKIGDGGNDINRAGNDTIVYLCDNNKNNCTILLTAHGAQDFRTKADALDLNSNNIDNTKVMFTENYPGQSGKYETGKQNNPDIPEPIMNPDGIKGSYIEWRNSNCYDSSKIDSNNVAVPSDVAGMGGCVYRDANIWQPGAPGKVRLTCEKWSN